MTSHIVDTGHWFVRAFTASLQAGNAGEDGVDEVLARLGEQDISAQAATVPQVRRLPACRFLPDAVAACLLSVPDLAAAIAALEDDLHWKQNPNYSDEAMGQPGYMNNYAYAEIIGPEGIWPGDDFLLTLLLLGPGLHYLRHSHPAPELYWILSGESQWQLRRTGHRGAALPWSSDRPRRRPGCPTACQAASAIFPAHAALSKCAMMSADRRWRPAESRRR
jgi:mannose-6-phosphate isomerase-like protein (cupin superfamily)